MDPGRRPLLPGREVLPVKFIAIDGSPVPKRLAPAVRRIKERSGQHLNSCYRGKDPQAANILRRYGKSTQAWLYHLYRIGRGNPANPPGFSTHELYNDGVAYRGRRGRPLRYYQVGMDWGPDSQQVIWAATKEGYTVTRTYPTSSREYHHLNFRRKPRIGFRNLKVGSKGKRVRKLYRQLHYLGYHVNAKGHLFGYHLRDAVKLFQRDHGQKPDGIYGIQTHRQLQASVRWHKRHGDK